MNDQLKSMTADVAKGVMTRREFVGRAAALGVTAAVANTMLADSARADGHGTPVRGGMLKIGSSGGESTNTQDPALAASEVPVNNLYAWGETLVEVDPSGELSYRLAESVEASADAKQWVFKIRKGIPFSNGKDMTPDDVMKTMQRHSNEDSKSGALGIMKGIADMKVDGDNFIVDLDTANADLPYLMADYHLIVQPNGGMDDPTAAIGTGAYTLEIDEPGVRHAFKRRDDYWDSENRGFADEVEQLVLNDATARTAALQSGQVHAINRVDPKVAALLDRAPNLSVQSIAGRGHYVFIAHKDTAPFDNNDVMLALKYAINREEMVDKILRGYGSIGNDMPINAAYPLFDETIPQREHSIEKAKEHYAKSGHDGSPIVLRVADGAFPGAVDAAALFQQSAQAAGIPLEIKREPNDGYWSEVWNVQPFCASYWSGRPVQDQMYATAYLSTADWNDTRWKRPEFDEMLNAAKSELDNAKRKEIYSKMGRMLNEEGGLILPMFNDFVSGVSNNLGGWVSDPGGDMMGNLAAVKCWVKDA
ncbi:Peptide/nickel/opine uptake family protein ABC transporter, periplasmic substrate-binding protein [Sulfitobacter noctilucicola]|uniref:Peptide/nickel transport system substrate-binding protein n=1 Tax=Sulfitobacter noctilucicola TaxID=1342301 RepID=A0A7W6Q675_9RHOB|nr:ABC transporter substrate-binding protein [Sulfitobacter noctilucicola]KIN64285.1 Peptide/nickel/opine uptake family protein ABC transporter, periplasmic substrate-binding protein [Sulfitobacter noctilucicola]MBB4174547.1 peptide/nickel transport system substrate-binding protein [Sulfitobacter noctilucicola]